MIDYTFLVEKGNVRIDAFLSGELLDMSRTAIQKLIEQNNVSVNGNNVLKSYRLKESDFVLVSVPPPIEIDVKPEFIDLDILYEDNDVIVINKPQGLVVHIGAGHYCGTLVNALLYHCRGSLSGINGQMRPGIVHRIDKNTSGVVVAAKNDFAHQKLAAQFAKHSITRVYNALVIGNIKEDNGSISAPIGRSTQDRKKMTVTNKNSKHAVTHFKVLQRFRDITHIEARLETGRTHQIRVHMAYISHPCVGDTVYGSKKNKYNLNGQALHARVLGFIHPTKNIYMEFEAPLPDYFKNILRLGDTN